MKRLSRHLGGPRLLIKRDDQTGLGLGGNKTRKLEYLISDALQLGHDSIITAGAAQSNHCRQTAAAAARIGLPCHLALGGTAPAVPNGNLLLDHLFGASIHWSGDARKGENIPKITAMLQGKGLNPCVIPYGGSSPIGSLGFVSAMLELDAQIPPASPFPDAIIFASSSGGTQSGLTVGATVLQKDISLIGINIDKGEAGDGSFLDHVAKLTNDTAGQLGLNDEYNPGNFNLRSDYVGEGYGVIGDLEREAILLAARFEGILLDPVYTARAFGGLVDMIANREFSANDTVLFWHTGGVPALFSNPEDLYR